MNEQMPITDTDDTIVKLVNGGFMNVDDYHDLQKECGTYKDNLEIIKSMLPVGNKERHEMALNLMKPQLDVIMDRWANKK